MRAEELSAAWRLRRIDINVVPGDPCMNKSQSALGVIRSALLQQTVSALLAILLPPHRRSSYDKMTFENFYHGLALRCNLQGLVHGQVCRGQVLELAEMSATEQQAKKAQGTRNETLHGLWQAQTSGC